MKGRIKEAGREKGGGVTIDVGMGEETERGSIEVERKGGRERGMMERRSEGGMKVGRAKRKKEGSKGGTKVPPVSD